jgi:hypothetical protein
MISSGFYHENHQFYDKNLSFYGKKTSVFRLSTLEKLTVNAQKYRAFSEKGRLFVFISKRGILSKKNKT